MGALRRSISVNEGAGKWSEENVANLVCEYWKGNNHRLCTRTLRSVLRVSEERSEQQNFHHMFSLM